jgi:hypothetical protein
MGQAERDFPYIIFHFSFVIADIEDSAQSRGSSMTNEKWKMIWKISSAFAPEHLPSRYFGFSPAFNVANFSLNCGKVLTG